MVGDFRVDLHAALIGRGSQGYVRKSTNINTDQAAAAKEIVCDDRVRRSEQYTRLLTELKVWKKLSHPFLVEFFHADYVDNFLYLVFQYCEQGSLNDFISSNELSMELRKRFMWELSDVVHYLHQENIMHRDIKPDNILIKTDSSGHHHIRLADLGLIKELPDAMREVTASFAGTVKWMAPEVYQASRGGPTRYSSKADVFSTGLVFHSIITYNNQERLQPITGQLLH